MQVGTLRHTVTIQTPGPNVPDGDGGFTNTWPALVSRIPASVAPASARDLERVVASTVQSTASHLVTIRYVAGVTTAQRVIFHDSVGDRTLSINGVTDEDERHVQLVMACTELVR